MLRRLGCVSCVQSGDGCVLEDADWARVVPEVAQSVSRAGATATAALKVPTSLLPSTHSQAAVLD